MTTALPPSLRADDAARYIGISRTVLYELFKSGEIEAIAIGGRRLFIRESLDRLVESRRGEAARSLRAAGAGRQRKAKASA